MSDIRAKPSGAAAARKQEQDPRVASENEVNTLRQLISDFLARKKGYADLRAAIDEKRKEEK